MQKHEEKSRRRMLESIGAVAFWIVVWQIASMAVESVYILAGPWDTLLALIELVPTLEFWQKVGFSTVRIVGGAALSYAVAIALAAAAHAFPAVRTLLKPALSAIKGTPVACVTVLLLIWFGSRNVSTIAVFLMALPVIYFPVLTGLDELDPSQRELFRLHGADRWRYLWGYIWPGLLPYITSASETALGMSWKAGVAAELIGTPLGSIGERIYQAKLLLQTANLFAWTIVVVLLSWTIEKIVLACLHASWPAAGRRVARRGAKRRGTMSWSCPKTDDGAVVHALRMEVGYEGEAVCPAVSFHLAPGERLFLHGPSGAGKTTIMETVAGSIEPVSGWGSLERRDGLQMSAVFQNTRLVEDLTSVENVRLFTGEGEAEVRAQLLELLPREALDAPVRELSGGQRRRVELVRALACPSDLVLLDEPFTGLDDEAHARALGYIEGHLDGRALIIASHDLEDAEVLGAKVLELAEK